QSGVIQFKVNDSQTGLQSYRATIDGRWALMEYSSKNRRLTLRMKDSPFKREGVLRDLCIVVTDNVGNKRTFQRKVRY
ncbi:MAG: hypothetical protein IKU98_01805, partial [Bacteroidaceae bacterium]|nr:hypothetical protein [Bacteroidaceae bacterium]